MPSRIDEAGHTKAFDNPVAEHWGKAEMFSSTDGTLTDNTLVRSRTRYQLSHPGSPRGSHNPGSSTGGIFCLIKCWVRGLAPILFAYRMLKHANIGYTPFRMLYNWDARLPVDLEFPQVGHILHSSVPATDGAKTPDTDIDELARYGDQMDSIQTKMYEKAHANIRQAQERQKKNDRRRAPLLFECGSTVLHKNLIRKIEKVGNLWSDGMDHTLSKSVWGKTDMFCITLQAWHFGKGQMAVI